MVVAKNLWSILGSAFYLPLIWILGKKSQRLFLKHDLVLFARIFPHVFLQIFWWSARAVWNSLQQQLTKTKPRSALLPPPGTEGNPAFDLSIQQLLGRRLGEKDIDISFTYAGIQIWIFESAAGASFVPCSFCIWHILLAVALVLEKPEAEYYGWWVFRQHFAWSMQKYPAISLFVGDTGECSVFPVTSKHGLSWRCLQDTSDTGSISSGADVQVCRTFGRHEFLPCCSDITSLDGRDVYYSTIHKLYDIKYTVWYGRYGNIVFKGQ